MKLHTATFNFEFVTDCFSGTAEGKNATHSELRVPPIRGHFRMWHVAAFGSDSCNAIWGSTAGDGSGSRVAMKLTSLPRSSNEHSDVLPHKDNPKHRGSRPALIAGSRAALELTRLPMCSTEQWDKAQRAVKLWLLLGTLGLRSARAAGSVWPLSDWVPQDASSLKTTLSVLGISKHSVALIGLGKGKSPSILRATASDTVSDRGVFGGINERAPSPTKFKVIKLGAEHCLLASAPHKDVVLGPGKSLRMIQRAEQLVNDKPQPARWRALGAWKHIIP